VRRPVCLRILPNEILQIVGDQDAGVRGVGGRKNAAILDIFDAGSGRVEALMEPVIEIAVVVAGTFGISAEGFVFAKMRGSAGCFHHADF
jgi:hypothetical protein